MRFFLSFSFLFFLQISIGQSIDFETFQQSLNAYGIETDEPTEGRANFFQPKKQSILKEDFQISLKKENIEIWLAFRPIDTSNLVTQMPNVFCRTMAVNAATNDEDAVTTVLKLSDEYLKETFGAEWGRELFFQPKQQLSERQHCRLISLYKEDVGHLNVFFFFDEKSKNLDAFSELFRFGKGSF